MKRINYEAIMAGSAIMVGLCALFVSINQTRIMQKQHEASIWPYVYHAMSYRDNGRFLYTVRNVGMGPAKIVDAKILYKDKEYTEYYEFLSDFLEMPIDSIERNVALGYSSILGRVLSPGEKIDALSISTQDVSFKLFNNQDKWTVKICYASISDKKWSNVSFGNAEEVENCE